MEGSRLLAVAGGVMLLLPSVGNTSPPEEELTERVRVCGDAMPTELAVGGFELPLFELVEACRFEIAPLPPVDRDLPVVVAAGSPLVDVEGRVELMFAAAARFAAAEPARDFGRGTEGRPAEDAAAVARSAVGGRDSASRESSIANSSTPDAPPAVRGRDEAAEAVEDEDAAETVRAAGAGLAAAAAGVVAAA